MAVARARSVPISQYTMNLAYLLLPRPPARPPWRNNDLRSNTEFEKQIIVDSFESRIRDRSPDSRSTGQTIHRAPKQRSRPRIGLWTCRNALPRNTIVQRNVMVVYNNSGLGISSTLSLNEINGAGVEP